MIAFDSVFFFVFLFWVSERLDVWRFMSDDTAVDVQMPAVLKLVGSFISCSEAGLAERVPGVFRGGKFPIILKLIALPKRERDGERGRVDDCIC